MYIFFILFFKTLKVSNAHENVPEFGTDINVLTIDRLSGFLSVNAEYSKKDKSPRIFNFQKEVIKLMYFEVSYRNFNKANFLLNFNFFLCEYSGNKSCQFH